MTIKESIYQETITILNGMYKATKPKNQKTKTRRKTHRTNRWMRQIHNYSWIFQHSTPFMVEKKIIRDIKDLNKSNNALYLIDN